MSTGVFCPSEQTALVGPNSNFFLWRINMRRFKPATLTEAQMAEVNGGTMNCIIVATGQPCGGGWHPSWSDALSQYFWGTIEVFLSPF